MSSANDGLAPSVRSVYSVGLIYRGLAIRTEESVQDFERSGLGNRYEIEEATRLLSVRTGHAVFGAAAYAPQNLYVNTALVHTKYGITIFQRTCRVLARDA